MISQKNVRSHVKTATNLTTHSHSPWGHFFVLTDRSDTACGAAICHEMDAIYRPIVLWGCTLRDVELNFTVTEKEALAVIKALKNHEDMLL